MFPFISLKTLSRGLISQLLTQFCQVVFGICLGLMRIEQLSGYRFCLRVFVSLVMVDLVEFVLESAVSVK